MFEESRGRGDGGKVDVLSPLRSAVCEGLGRKHLPSLAAAAPRHALLEESRVRFCASQLFHEAKRGPETWCLWTGKKIQNGCKTLLLL